MSLQSDQKKEVLLVEDDFITVKLIENIFEGICNLENVNNATQAIQKARSKQYDAIIMDINLGKSENGMYATKQIREIDSHKNTPIIALTAYTMAGDKEEFLKGGCTHYMSKPIDIKEFMALMKQILGI
ncbi:MAG: response regulator [Ignavibacteriae bacterium]|nr:response regulator [Ignavibacteriota bacterium]